VAVGSELMPNTRKILIVDDDPQLRDALTEKLSLHEEFEAVAAHGGPYKFGRGRSDRGRAAITEHETEARGTREKAPRLTRAPIS